MSNAHRRIVASMSMSGYDPVTMTNEIDRAFVAANEMGQRIRNEFFRNVALAPGRAAADIVGGVATLGYNFGMDLRRRIDGVRSTAPPARARTPNPGVAAALSNERR